MTSCCGLPVCSCCSVIKVHGLQNVSEPCSMHCSCENVSCICFRLKEWSWIMVASLQPGNDVRPNYTNDTNCNDFCTVNLLPLFFFVVRMIFIPLYIFLSNLLVDFSCHELFYLWFCIVLCIYTQCNISIYYRTQSAI